MPSRALHSVTMRLLGVVVLASILPSFVLAASPSRLGPRPAPSASELPRQSVSPAGWLASVPVGATIGLPSPSAAESKKARDVSGAVGYGRPATATKSTERIVATASVVKLIVTSPEAVELRVELEFADGGRYRVTAFAPGDETRAVAFERDATPATAASAIWTPITHGSAQVIVVERLDGTAGWTIAVPRVSHFVSAVLRPDAESKAFGDSSSCQSDVPCLTAGASPEMRDRIDEAARSVALVVATFADGLSRACTGTLLNSASFPAPLFLTAYHCTPDATALASMTTIWFYARAACGSARVASEAIQVAGGAVPVFGGPDYDTALVVLRQFPPANAVYGAWDGTPLAANTGILAIHHPRADVKKASFGMALGTNTAPVGFAGLGAYPEGWLYVVNWQIGFVEPGSSGSGLLSFDEVRKIYFLRGTLTGGDVTCSNGATTYYQRFDSVFANIRTVLTEPVFLPLATVVEYYYGAWDNYFISAFPDEQRTLDGGAFGGVWQRTGETFKSWIASSDTALPTCRFFSTSFAPRSSHFYTPSATECARLMTSPDWQFEAIAFFLELPDAAGHCRNTTVPLYRLYNNGMGGSPNHRYTTSRATFDRMRGSGWVFEGHGLTGAFACVPQ